jgi:hypothetical protein
MCSVLAHELRSPLSVLQGYIRLLQRQREPGHPEMAMLEAMLDATGRLTTIARQPFGPVAVTAVADALADRLRNMPPAVALLPVPATPLTLRADPAALAGAIVALAESMHRDNESAVIEISVLDSQADGSVGFALGPASSTTGTASSPGRPTSPGPSFDRGGAGLALIAASHVLDQHGASFDATTAPGHIVIRFPHPGGSQ